MKNKLADAWFKFWMWLVDNRPVICAKCDRIFKQSDTVVERLTNGGKVRLCHDCHAEIFTPFTGRKS